MLVFIGGSMLPPYIPKEAMAQAGENVQITDSQFLLVEDGFLMKSSSLTEQGTRRAYARGLTHVVKEGETVEGLAERYRISEQTIRWANKLGDDEGVQPGRELVILPVDGVIHTVGRGQTLNRIAALYEVPAAEIAEQNDVEGGFILSGQELIIPGGKPIIEKPVEVAVTPPPENPAKPAPAPPSEGQKPAVTPPPAAVAVTAAAVPSTGILQMPCNNCYYTQYYNPGHYAVDIQEKGGGAIFAAEGGTVIRADYGWNGGYGNVLEVDHGNGLVTLYAHNKELYVGEGDTVERGQSIAWMGNTGRVYGKTGIHTHFEVRVNGVKKNPLLYLQ